MRPLALATVLAATDLGPSADVALETGRRLANAAGAALHVVHVRNAASRPGDDVGTPEARAPELTVALRRTGIPERRAKLHVVPGSPADAIRALSETVGADVIVVGPPHEVGNGRRLGGTARAIAIAADAPCLAAVRPLPLPLERVIVPIDFSDTARGALLVGLSWASALRAGGAGGRRTTLIALHVSSDQHGSSGRHDAALEEELDAVRRSAGSWAGVEVEGDVVAEAVSTAATITHYASERQADLLVLGTRGLGLDAAERLGSVSGLVVEQSPVPVLLVPPRVWREHLSD